jgi:hypothetical protein
MSRVSDILVRVRDSLADPNKERWSDERLLRLVDEGQRVIAHRAKTLRKKTVIPLLINQAWHQLPSDCHRVIRILGISDEPLPILTHEQMDNKYGVGWETDTGATPKAIVFDKTNTGVIKVYPIPSSVGNMEWVFTSANAATWNSAGFNQLYGVAIDSAYTGDSFIGDYGVVVDLDYTSPFVIDTTLCTGYSVVDDGVFPSLYGVLAVLDDGLYTFTSYDAMFGIIADVESYTLSSSYGITVDMSDDYLNTFVNVDPEIDGIYGFMVYFNDAASGLTVYYLKKPIGIDSIGDKLEIDSIADIALKHYIVGMCLRDDKDAQNRSMGNEELQLFANALKELTTDGEQDHMAQNTQYEIPYNGGFL